MKNKFDFRNVLTISFAHMVHDTYSAFLAPILPLLIERLGISIFQAGILDVLRKVPALINPLVGVIADRYTLRYFVVAGPIVTTISMSLLGICPNYTVLMILVLLSGISSVAFHIPTPSMVKQSSGNKIGVGMSYYMLGGELARTLGPLTVLGGISLWRLEGIYRLIPFGLVASFVLHIRLKNIAANTNKEEIQHSSLRGATRRNLPFIVLIGGFVFFQAAIKSSLTIYLPTYLTYGGSSLWIAGVSLSILQFAGVGGVFFAGRISDKIGCRKLLLLISIINPILMFLFVHFNDVLSIPLLVLSGFFIFMSGPVVLAFIHEINISNGSFVNGLYMTTNIFMGSCMTLLIGEFSDRFGLEQAYEAVAYIGIAAIPFTFLLNRTRHSH